MEHALVRRDVRMLHDPMRTQSRALTVGVVLACLGLAACGVLALLRPQDKIGDNKILVGKDSGAMFVVLGDTVHPVLNLASARLAVGDAAKPAIVKESELGKRPRGPLVGIPGAPSALPFDTDGAGRTWTVCDTVDGNGSRASNSVLVGRIVSDAEHAAPLGHGEALLLGSGRDTYLVYDGKRAKIDLADRAVTAALALDSIQPRPATAGLLNAIPEVPAVAPPVIDGAGTTPAYPMTGLRVGSVVQTPRGSGAQYYVVLRDGIQQISSATADIIRAADSQGTTEITKVAPDVVSRAPIVQRLAVDDFPQTMPMVVNARTEPVSCLSWEPMAGGESNDDAGVVRAQVRVLSGRQLPIAEDAKMVQLAQADGSGTKADRAYVTPGSGAYLQSTGIAPTSERKGGLFYVADTGVRFGIPDTESATLLGMDVRPEPAPWPIVGLLAPGPTLGKAEALVAHDGVAPDQAPAALPASDTGR